MKKVILIFGMLISFINLSAQNSDPSQVKFIFANDTSYISTEPGGNFYKNTFFRGWHWDSRASISTGLLMNQNHIYDWNNYLDDNRQMPTINDNVNLFIVSNQAFDSTGPKYLDKIDTTFTVVLDSIIVIDTVINGQIVQLQDSITHIDTTITPIYSDFKKDIPLFVDHNFPSIDKEYYTLLNARSVQYEPTFCKMLN